MTVKELKALRFGDKVTTLAGSRGVVTLISDHTAYANRVGLHMEHGGFWLMGPDEMTLGWPDAGVSEGCSE
jgi:hypothetical protein